MKKKIIITEEQYKRLNSKLSESLSLNDDVKTAAVHSGTKLFENFINRFNNNFNADELTEIANFLTSGIKSSLESHYSDLSSNAGSASDEYKDDDDDMTYDQFGGETHGY